MGDIIAAIDGDMNDYRRLCKKYNEKLQYDDHGFPDCYGDHAKGLIRKERDESRKESR